MSYNGSGIFVRLYNWVNDAANSINIRADRMDAEMDGFAAGLSNAITRDGQGKPTAAINWNGQTLSNVASLQLNNPLAVGYGGTGATTAPAALTALGAAASGANSDITSLAGMTTALSIAQGGTGATTAAAARTALGAMALSGNNTATGVNTFSYAGIPVNFNSTNSTVSKLGWQDAGTPRGYLGASSTYCLVVSSNVNGQVATIDNSGNVSAASFSASGTVTSTAQAYVNRQDTINEGGKLFLSRASDNNATNYWQTYGGGTTPVMRYVSPSGQVFSISSTGDVTASGNISGTSDERLKTNWRNLPSDFVERLAGVKHGVYDRTDTDITQVGVSAQSLQTVMPEAVLADDKGMLSVAYGNAALTAVIELAKRVVELEAKLAAL